MVGTEELINKETGKGARGREVETSKEEMKKDGKEGERRGREEERKRVAKKEGGRKNKINMKKKRKNRPAGDSHSHLCYR